MLRVSAAFTILLSPGGRAGFQDVNPPTVPNGTALSAAWHNDVQENICGLIESAGMTLSDGSSYGGAEQMGQAVRRIAAGNASGVVGASGGTSVALTPDLAGRVYVNAAAGPVTLTLPAAALPGVLITTPVTNTVSFQIFRTDTSANAVTVVAAGSDTVTLGTIVGAASVLVPPAGKCRLDSDGSAVWYAEIPSARAQLQGYAAAGTYSYVVPAGVTKLPYTLVGAGGGSGGTHASGDTSMPGAGSPHATGVLDVVPGETLTIVVGAGGTAGAGGSSPTAGGTGGTSSIARGATVLVSASGGGGGVASNGAGLVTTNNSPGAIGGTIAPAVTLSATSGGYAVLISGTTFFAGNPGGPGGLQYGVGVTGGLLNGATPHSPGAGAYGALNGGAGGVGAAGLVTVGS